MSIQRNDFSEKILYLKHVIFFGSITIISLVIRYRLRLYIGGDMQGFLIPWFNEIQSLGGFQALSKQVGDYNIFYQFLICIFTYLPFGPIYPYKCFSIIFDYLIAFLVGIIVSSHYKERLFGFWFNLSYGTIIIIPTVFINSAMWGQCDSVYTFFLLGALFCIMRNKDILAYVMLGIALVFKLQTVLFLPFIICYYLYTKRFKLTLFLIPVLVLWLSGIPGYVNGRSLMSPFSIYLFQVSEYKEMFLNTTSFWQITGNNTEFLYPIAVLLTIALVGICVYIVLEGRIKIDSHEKAVAVAAWLLWICLFFLPSMHERYTYPLDLLLLLVSFYNKKYIPFFLVEMISSLCFYCNFLLHIPAQGYMLSVISLIALTMYSRLMLNTSYEST